MEVVYVYWPLGKLGLEIDSETFIPVNDQSDLWFIESVSSGNMRGTGTEKALQCGKLSQCFCVTDPRVAGGIGELNLMD